jgi:hypothetical protein
MARVYISSTFKDLKEQRSAAREAVLSLNHMPIGMETYSASRLRPIEFCLKDVRGCQIYLGIFAWRYGEIEKKYGKSFTHLEYEQAVRSGLPCLIFLLHEEAEWVTSRCDSDKARITQFRQQLAENHLPAHFRTTDDLKYKVIHALTPYGAEGSGVSGEARPIPDLLPYLADVTGQEYEIHKALQARREAPKRPVVCLTYGDELQSHEMIARRFEEYSLRQLLSMQPSDPAVSSYLLRWPSVARTQKDLGYRLQLEVTSAVMGRPAELPELINQLARIPGPILFRCFLLTENLLDSPVDAIESFLSFWQEFPDLGREQILVTCLFVKLQSRRGLLGVLSRESRRFTRMNDRVRQCVDALKFEHYKGITGAFLGPLEGVTQAAAEDWVRQHASRFTQADALIPSVRTIFENWYKSSSRSAMPMEKAAAAFRATIFGLNHKQEVPE